MSAVQIKQVNEILEHKVEFSVYILAVTITTVSLLSQSMKQWLFIQVNFLE